MKQLCFLVPLFSIPLVNGMVNQHVELEQSVEEPNVAVAEMHSLDIPQVELDVHEAKRPLLSRRAKAIIAFAFLALLLALTFYSVYKIKHKERLERERLVAEWEQKLVKFREFVKEEEKQLTKAQKKTLQNMKEQVKEFIEKGYNPVFFEQELKNNLMQFLADGLGGPIWNFNFKKLFERSFFDSFFDVENYYFLDDYLNLNLNLDWNEIWWWS